MPENTPADAYALDFDGVICDSAAESAVTAWRAGAAIWPDWRDPQPPEHCLRGFLAIRPLMETGYQAVPMMRLVWEGKAEGLDPESFEAAVAEVMAAHGCSRQRMVELFGTARDDWLRLDPDGWLQRHRFYPQVLPALAAVLTAATGFIVTTKQERFVHALLAGQGLAVPAERVFGLERGIPKEKVLSGLLQRPELRHHRLHFVEDRLQTLLRVRAAVPDRRLQLHLVAWGYNTEQERLRAAHEADISLLAAGDFPPRTTDA
jgi:phosphoglycolate phosphatase-like HAD superfamily hydrolase